MSKTTKIILVFVALTIVTVVVLYLHNKSRNRVAEENRTWLKDYLTSKGLSQYYGVIISEMSDDEVNTCYDAICNYEETGKTIPADLGQKFDAICNKYNIFQP
jgi:hypothetical protein